MGWGYRRKRAVVSLVVGGFMSCQKVKGKDGIVLSSCRAARFITHDKVVMGMK
jgi:hypothetical protein